MVRKAISADFLSVKMIYSEARKMMRESGNPNQWGDSYPSDAIIAGDIEDKNLYVIVRNDLVCGVFFFAQGPDSDYLYIDGTWKDDSEYGIIHRVAAKRGEHGVFNEILNFASSQIRHLRIDTHSDNKVMQHVLEKNGFISCGTVYVGDKKNPRIAYEKY